MASTREERLQMRQRGAGTREIKKVNFGFSFGGPALGSPEPAPLFDVPEPAVPPQTQPAPTSTPQASQASSQADSRGNGETRHTPGSARNQLPQRPSTYDIPSDEGPGEPRSSKRRRINPPPPESELLPRLTAPKSQTSDSTTFQNGHSRDSDTDAPANRASGAAVTDAPTTTVNHPPDAQSSLPESSTNERTSTSGNSGANGAGVVNSARAEEQTQSRKQESRPGNVAAPDTRGTRSARGRSPKASSPKPQPIVEAQSIEATRNKQRRIPSRRQIEGTGNEATAQHDKSSKRMPTSPKANRGTKPKAKGARNRGEAADAPEANKDITIGTEGPSQLPTAEKVVSEVENQTRSERASSQPDAASKPKRPRGRPSLASKMAETRDKDRPETAVEPTSTAGESSATGARRGRKKKAEARLEPVPRPEPEPELELEETQEPEPEQEQEAEAAAPKSRRGRPAKKTKRTAERERSPTEDQPDTETTRQTREPRGETVPVTVHRLTNASALGAMYADAAGSGEEDEDSADELSIRQKTKLPNRGGVNPADVLSQICRETLEKTLTTLKNGIANETNSTRRAEWTRKRKAVEAFSSGLDGRLLDLSEMLDSNFVLGVQLKKAKREMMDLRSHLYKVRRERESIALQMDAVRAKHMEEENAKTARTTINNSLHSLELALDRSRAPSSTESSSADLEFMLRTVADDVSSRAPGGQGGLLQQIRAFNAQLESTARRLEGT